MDGGQRERGIARRWMRSRAFPAALLAAEEEGRIMNGVMDPYALKLLILFAAVALFGFVAALRERRERNRDASE